MDDQFQHEIENYPERDRAPALAELWQQAEAGRFADVFADLRAAEFSVQRLDPAGQPVMQSKRLNPRQAWFIAWYGADERVREPKTVAGVAKLLNVSRTTLYKWQSEDWFTLTGVTTWERRFVASHIPALYRKLMSNALEGDGSTSNTAIKTALDIWAKHTDEPAQAGGPTAAVQVNVNGQSVEVVERAKDRLAERLAELAGRE